MKTIEFSYSMLSPNFLWIKNYYASPLSKYWEKRIERQSMPRGSWFNAAAQERSRPDQSTRILFVLIKNVYNLMLQLGFFLM